MTVETDYFEMQQLDDVPFVYENGYLRFGLNEFITNGNTRIYITDEPNCKFSSPVCNIVF